MCFSYYPLSHAGDLPRTGLQGVPPLRARHGLTRRKRPKRPVRELSRTQFYVYPLNPGKRLVFADSPRPLQRRGPSQDGPTVIRETQDGYGRSSSSLPDLGPPSKSATSCESVPSMRRAFCDSAAPRSSMSADERGMHKLSSAAGSVTCECFQTNYHHQ